jgi:hypothetical protein
MYTGPSETLSTPPTVWLAVFILPPPGHLLAEQGSFLIGYDVWSQEVFADRDANWPGFSVGDVSRIRAPVRPYGVHITVGDALDYPFRSLVHVIERLEAITSQLPPFQLRGASYVQDFGGSLLALQWQEGSDHVHRLAVATAVHINTLRQRPPRVTVPMTTYPDMLRDWAIEATFGYFWTIEKFRPYLALAGALNGRAERDKLRAAWQKAGLLRADTGSYTLDVDRVYLMLRPKEQEFWQVHPEFPDGFPLRGR